MQLLWFLDIVQVLQRKSKLNLWLLTSISTTTTGLIFFCDEINETSVDQKKTYRYNVDVYNNFHRTYHKK